MFGSKLKQLSKLTGQVRSFQRLTNTRNHSALFNNFVTKRYYAHSKDVTPAEKPKDEVGEAKSLDEPPFVRIYDVNPNPTVRTWSQTLAPTRPGERNELESYWLNMPTLWERAVGNERAELIDPHIYDELLPEIIDIDSGVGSSFYQPIIISSLGESERVVGCLGRCYDGDNIDLDSTEMQYWVMTENTFGVCDECGLVFYLASQETLSQMEIWRQLQEEGRGGDYNPPPLIEEGKSSSQH
jgi:hypothetical protein